MDGVSPFWLLIGVLPLAYVMAFTWRLAKN